MLELLNAALDLIHQHQEGLIHLMHLLEGLETRVKEAADALPV
jgi:hypothetical protein